MKQTGTLLIVSGVSRLDGTLLARRGAPDPFQGATAFLHGKGFEDGDTDNVTVTGDEGTVGDAPVIFITDAEAAALAPTALASFTARAEPPLSKKAAKKAPKKAAKKVPAKQSKPTRVKRPAKQGTKSAKRSPGTSK